MTITRSEILNALAERAFYTAPQVAGRMGMKGDQKATAIISAELSHIWRHGIRNRKSRIRRVASSNGKGARYAYALGKETQARATLKRVKRRKKVVPNGAPVEDVFDSLLTAMADVQAEVKRLQGIEKQYQTFVETISKIV